MKRYKHEFDPEFVCTDKFLIIYCNAPKNYENSDPREYWVNKDFKNDEVKKHKIFIFYNITPKKQLSELSDKTDTSRMHDSSYPFDYNTDDDDAPPPYSLTDQNPIPGNVSKHQVLR